ncbi:PepSY-associated TM helix domain-containing protein [Galbibacter sp.]|uniref:PepSY-associated TM helix domain-containing protein n=1 Tax=Galbibacter sp. TaxID=2918471 RepID=UPI003A8E0756
MKKIKLLQYHSICSLIAGGFLILLGITGSILIFNEDIDQALFAPYQVNDTAEVLNLDSATAAVQKKYKNWNTRIIHFKKGESIVFNIRRPEQRMFVFVHPENGEILGAIDESTHLTKWLLKFHYSFHSGVIGRILVLIFGTLFLISLITGTLLYRKNIRKVLLFKIKLKPNKRRAFYSALHSYIGVWALLLNLILAITGVLLAYSVSVAGLKTPKEPEPPLVATSLDKVLSTIDREIPEFHPSYIRLASSKKAPIVINGSFEDDPFVYSIHYNKILVSNTTGDIEKVKKVSEQPLIYKANSMITPLHYGQFAGLIGKLVYCLIGMSGPVLSITGFIIWYKRKNTNHKNGLKPKL